MSPELKNTKYFSSYRKYVKLDRSYRVPKPYPIIFRALRQKIKIKIIFRYFVGENCRRMMSMVIKNVFTRCQVYKENHYKNHKLIWLEIIPIQDLIIFVRFFRKKIWRKYVHQNACLKYSSLYEHYTKHICLVNTKE